MSSILDEGNNPVTIDFLYELGFSRISPIEWLCSRGGNYNSGIPYNIAYYKCFCSYRYKDPEWPWGGPVYNCVLITIELYEGRTNDPVQSVDLVFKDIKSESELISTIRATEKYYGISIIKRK